MCFGLCISKKVKGKIFEKVWPLTFDLFMKKITGGFVKNNFYNNYHEKIFCFKSCRKPWGTHQKGIHKRRIMYIMYSLV